MVIDLEQVNIHFVGSATPSSACYIHFHKISIPFPMLKEYKKPEKFSKKTYKILLKISLKSTLAEEVFKHNHSFIQLCSDSFSYTQFKPQSVLRSRFGL